MDKACFELGTEEGSPQLTKDSSYTPILRRSARLIAKKQSLESLPKPSLSASNSSLERVSKKSRTHSERSLAEEEEESTTIQEKSNKAKRKKISIKSPKQELSAESPASCDSTGKQQKTSKGKQPIRKRSRSHSSSAGLEEVCLDHKKYLQSYQEDKCEKKHKKRVKKLSDRSLISGSGSENDSTSVTDLGDRQKNKKRKRVDQDPPPLITKSPKLQSKVKDDNEDCTIVTKETTTKGKSRRKRKNKQEEIPQQERVVRKSVIQYAMSNKDHNQPGPSGEGNEGSNDLPGEQATGSPFGDGSDPVDPFLALMNEESKRLQMMLESRGLPPHLLGSLGPRIPHFFHKHMSSSNNTKAHQLLEGLQCVEDESVQLQSCIEIGQLLVMGNEDTLSGFPVKEAVPALIHLLSMEHNFDMMMNACRALTYMMEALPRSTVVVSDAIPVLLEKLQIIQCMDVAEQALSALDILSLKHSKSILQAGGVNACLLYLDFFSLNTQRSALSVAANCCLSVAEEDFQLVTDSIPILSNRLQHQDKKSVESCCLSFSRLVDNLHNHPKLLQEIASQGLLPNIQNLLMMSPSIITSHMFVVVIRMLSTLCSVCPILAVDMLKLNMGETLKYLLVGPEEITLETIEINSRSSNEFYEIVSLISELMPPLPKDGIFEVDKLLITSRRHMPTSVQWEWQDDNGSWQPYTKVENRIIEAAHMAGEEDIAVDIHGRTYIIEFGVMHQINEETGNTRAIRRSTVDSIANKDSEEKAADEDPRLLALCAEPSLSIGFLQSLVAVLYEVFSNMAAPSIKYKCLKALLRMLNCTMSEVLTDILSNISVSSYIATMLKSQDYRIVVGAIQMAVILIDKMPNIFIEYFHREGVMHAMENLKTLPLKAMVTPKKPEQTKPSVPPPSAVISPPLPIPPLAMSMPHPSSSAPIPLTTDSGIVSVDSPSTARRFVDMFRKSRRHLRKSLSRARSEDVSETPSIFMSGRPMPSMPLLPPPTLAVSPPYLSSITGAMGGTSKKLESATKSEESSTNKEKIREWIVQQVTLFLDKWSVKSGSSDMNPALEVMKILQAISDQLDPANISCLKALNDLCQVLCNPKSNATAFEFLHCDIPKKLTRVISLDDSQYSITLNARLRHFVHIFMGLPEQDAELSSWTPQERPGLTMLLQKLHACISQTEQLPVKVHDMPGKRGSQALKFFNTHQIKCNLECHPSASGLQSWKGGIVRVDPLATLQAVERYLLMKGVTRPEQTPLEDTEGSDDSESEDAMLPSLPTGPMKQQLEFLINDNVIPHHTTVFQAIKQFGLTGGSENEDDTSMSALGHPDIWIKSHLIQYRLIGQGQSSMLASRPKRSYSLPATPLDTTPTQLKRLHTANAGSSGPKARRNLVSSKLTTPSLTSTEVQEGVRVTRSMSREQQREEISKSPDNMETDIECVMGTSKLSPLLLAIEKSKTPLNIKDPARPVINLLRILWSLNNHWNDLYNGFPGNPIVASSEFISSKLTAKATRQIQDPLNVMTGNFPDWLKHLSKHCPFLFPFECRQTLFYFTTFDRDRGITRLQEQQPELSTDTSEQIKPKLEKKKRCVSREGLLMQAEKIMEEVASSRALLEVQYQDEVGIGLGPTLEFYTLVSRELQQADLHMWRGDPCPLPGISSIPHASDSNGVTQYVYSPVGLFPAPLSANTNFSIVEEVCNKFRFLGRFMAKAIMDSRMLDLPLSNAFYKWMLGQEDSFTAQDLQYVDPVIARSFAQIADVAVKKHQLENDPLLTGTALQLGIQSLTLEGGGSIEDLELDFTLPGYPDIELKPNGKDIPVTIHNVDEYLKLVLDWTLVTGVARQMEAFRDGFNSVFPMSSLQQFYSHEMDMFLCGANNQKWDIKELMEYCRPDHGYTHDSQAIQFLFRVLSSYSTTEQRQFVQFVTGSPRLPVGGFKALNPPLTIVRKTVEFSQSPDNFLPSVMTCVNYLKLPDYTSEEVMREKVSLALREGKQSFHLS